MDRLPALGKDVFQVLGPTSDIYIDLLSQPTSSQAIGSATPETLSYGNHERQTLDLYTPPTSTEGLLGGSVRPVLIYLYGGAFVSGDKILKDAPGGLVYKNLGYFFSAKLGYETMLIDYRLLNHGGSFDTGEEDLSVLFDWIEQRYDHAKGDVVRPVYLLGSSAGAIHIATWTFGDRFRQQREAFVAGKHGVKLSGIIFLGCTWNWDRGVAEPLREILRAHYGGDENIKKNEAVAILSKAARQSGSRITNQWPRMLTLVSELDPEEMVVQSSTEAVKTWRASGGEMEFQVLKGHNHISPPLSLGTGIEREEAWAYDVARWMSQ